MEMFCWPSPCALFETIYVAHKIKTQEKHSPIKIKPYCFSACSLPATVCELTSGSVQCCNTNLFLDSPNGCWSGASWFVCTIKKYMLVPLSGLSGVLCFPAVEH